PPRRPSPPSTSPSASRARSCGKWCCIPPPGAGTRWRSTGSPHRRTNPPPLPPRTAKHPPPRSPPPRPTLPRHTHLPRRFPAGEFHLDRHRPLIHAHLAHNQRAFLQLRRLHRRTRRRLHSLRHAPAAAFLLHRQRNAQRNLLPAHGDLRLVLGRPRLQIHHRLRHSHRRPCHLLRKRHRLRIHRNLRQPLHHLRRPACLAAAVQILRQESLRRHEHRHVLHRPRKPVALVRRHQVLHREIAVAQRDHKL